MREANRRFLGLFEGASMAEVEKIVDPISVDADRATGVGIMGVVIVVHGGDVRN